MSSKQLRKKFLSFFKKRGHKIVPSSSLLPDDPSVLFTTAGMQQFVPFLTGRITPLYRKACSVQKCFRTDDIEEVGDNFHHTFFEMLGNWSFGDPKAKDGIGDGYFKKEAIKFALEFLLNELGLDKKRLYVTIFKGDKEIPKDTEAKELWIKYGIPKDRIFEFGRKENFWGPTGEVGPCGPCSEIHYDLTGKPCKREDKCAPNCPCGRFIEIWNLVFMEYEKKIDDQKSGIRKYYYELLPQKNIDTGIGLERLTAVAQNKRSSYDTDLFSPIGRELENLVGGTMSDSFFNRKEVRIILDHIRAICFLISDGVLPSNVEQGYILRRLLRRIIRYGNTLNLGQKSLINLAKKVVSVYKDTYPELSKKENDILTIISSEYEKFSKALERGLRQFNKLISKIPSNETGISGKQAFELYTTYGFPLEFTKELASERGIRIDEKGFYKELEKHKAISGKGREKKFGGHGLGEARVFSKEDEEKIKRLHTATHLLHQALRDVLGNQVKQMGSDITPERLRFDFSYPKKLTSEQIEKVEKIVNEKIKENLPVKVEEMKLERAIESGALGFFRAKYPEIVKVYSIGSYSKEICAGPHVSHTKELGEFKIIKEEASSAGVRRIKAVLKKV